jgi:hypothetical protein
VIVPVHIVIICVFIPERSPCESCNRKGLLCQDRTEPSKHHEWPDDASSSRSMLDAISIRPGPTPEHNSSLREGKIYALSSVFTHLQYFTPSSACETQINNTQLVLVPSAVFGHLRLLPSGQASTSGLTFPHCQGAPEHGYLRPGAAGLPSMGI